jgi:hypothetical protein
VNAKMPSQTLYIKRKSQPKRIIIHPLFEFVRRIPWGQFWFLLQDGSVYEPFWLEANPVDREAGGPGSEYAHRSCAEVLTRFAALAGTTDFDKEARRFRSLESSFRLMFNAYFVTEQQFLALGLEDAKPRG